MNEVSPLVMEIGAMLKSAIAQNAQSETLALLRIALKIQMIYENAIKEEQELETAK